jgi:SH3-like domain-containing protein
VKWLVLVSLTLRAAAAIAAPAYVSDELVLGVYSEQNNQGQRLTTLHSGASVETLAVNGDFTQVRLNDGTTGWVKSAYLTTQEPAVVRIKQLQDELDRSRATTPALAEAAARSEVEQLKRELAAKQSELMAANAALGPTAGSGAGSSSGSGSGAGSGTADAGALTRAALSTAAGVATAPAGHAWIGIAAVPAALGVGFWLGYAALARRIKHKYGGLKVY